MRRIAVSSLDEYFLSVSDLVSLCRKKKRQLFLSALCGAALLSFFSLFREPLYEATASFREKGAKESEAHAPTKLLLKATDDKTGEAIQTMRSRALLTDVVQKRALQGKLEKKSFVPRTVRRLATNLQLQWAHLQNQETDPFESTEHLILETLFYPEEITRTLELFFTSPEEFLIAEKSGKLGEKIEVDSFSFTLSKKPQKMGARYKLTLLPLHTRVQALQKALQISEDDEDLSLIRLSLKAPDRKEAKETLDQVMQSYQEKLQQDSHEEKGVQLRYLAKKREELFKEQKKLLEEHAQLLYAKSSPELLHSATEEISFLTQARHKTSERLLALDQAGTPTLPSYQKLEEEISQLKQKVEKEEEGGLSQNSYTLSVAELLLQQTLQECEQCNARQTTLKLAAEQLEKRAPLPKLQERRAENLLTEMEQLSEKLSRDKNYSPKEVERLESTLQKTRDTLQKELSHLAELEKKKKSSLEEKGRALQSNVSTKAKERIALLRKEIEEKRVEEKKQLKSKLTTLYQKIAALPNKWAEEQLLSQRLNVSRSSFEELSKNLEIKQITSFLESSSSKPLESAYAPPLPLSPYLFSFALFGAVLGALSSFFFYVATLFFKGVEATEQNLSFFTPYVAGTFCDLEEKTALTDRDLSVLRKALFFAGKNRLLCLLNETGVPLAEELAALYRKQGETSLVLSLECSRNLPEILSSKKLSCYLEEGYDRLLFELPYSPSSGEALVSMQQAEFTIALTGKCPLHALNNALKKAEKKQLCFLFSSR